MNTALRRATLSRLRALGFRTVMRAGHHTAYRWDQGTITMAFVPDHIATGCAMRLVHSTTGTRVLASAFQVDPLCLTSVVTHMIDGRESTDTMHSPQCTCPNES